ncbi:hypothetical protein, partial [Allisonella histaminiformans]|uniref:hypothetical protein n=3 Tax=cellular organisms TaxID=131567 RepID=UPI003F89CDB5
FFSPLRFAMGVARGPDWGTVVEQVESPVLSGRVLDDGFGESVRQATDAALRECPPSRRARGLVAVIRRLADAIDAIDAEGLNPAGKLDNVTIPTYLRYAEALGMTLSKAASPPKPEAHVVPDDSPGARIIAMQQRASRRGAS